MLQIIRVDTLDSQTLDIELNNGHLILLSMKDLLEQNSNFLALKNLEALPCPKTDGNALFWKGGEQLLLSEIMDMLQQEQIRG
jgi:hypothetical protein